MHIISVLCIVSALAWGSVANKLSESTELLLTRGISTGAVRSWGSALYRCAMMAAPWFRRAVEQGHSEALSQAPELREVRSDLELELRLN